MFLFFIVLFSLDVVQTKLSLFLLVLMTHASEDLSISNVGAAHTENDNELSENGQYDVDQWRNDHSSSLQSEKTEEKIVTVIKKVWFHKLKQTI